MSSQEKIDLTKEKNEENFIKFGGHNYKADIVWTNSFHQKANGETQIDKFRLETSTIDGMIETVVDTYIKLYEYGVSKGLKMVSPFANKK